MQHIETGALLRLLTILITVGSLTACHAPKRKAAATGYQPRYAQGFKTDTVPGASIITVYNPWQGDAKITMQIFVPDSAGVHAPKDFDGVVLDRLPQRIIATSSTHVAMLDAIGAIDRLVGVSGIDYISNPYVQAHRDSLVDIGPSDNADFEAIIAANPDIVLVYGIDAASPMQSKLDQLGIPYMYVGEYLEESPLGKAEWMIALGTLTGRVREAGDVFGKIVPEYTRWKNIAARAKKQYGTEPVVMLNTPYNDAWMMPPVSSYMVRLIEDAGGRYAYPANTTRQSKAIDLEEAYLTAARADCWLNVDARCHSIDDLLAMCPKFADIPAVTSGRIYNNNRRQTPGGGNDWYESGVVHPDVMLRDIVKIMHPAVVSDEFVYYKQLH